MEEVSSGMKRKMDSCDVSEADQTNNNPLYCSVCDVVCNSTAMMENHVNGKKHKKKMLGQSRRTINPWEFWCDSCLIACNSHATMKMHLDGKMHQESCCKRRRRLLQDEIKKEESPNCKEILLQMEEESTNKEACCNEKEDLIKNEGANCKELVNMEDQKEEDQACNEKEAEIEQVCIKEELIKLQVEITEETCNYKKEEELKVEIKKDVCDDEKMQDEANNVITEHQEDEVMVEEEIKKDNVCDDDKMQQDKANQIIKEEKTAIKQEECHATEVNTSGKDGLWCDICELQCNSYLMMSAHLSGKKHTAMEAKAGLKVNKDRLDLQQDEKMREMKEERNKEFWCLICKVTCDTQAMMTKHLKGAEHKAKVASRRH